MPSSLAADGLRHPDRPYWIIIPARNEAPTIGDLVSRIVGQGGFDVVVVDDASTDGTAALALQAGATVLRLAAHAGAWCAVQTGFRHALARGALAAVTFDADGQHHPETVFPVLAGVIGSGWDVAIGSCPQRAGALKKTAWAILRGLAGSPVDDITSGLRAYNRRAMEVLLTPAATRLDYQDVGVLLLLAGAGLQVGEVPVPMSQRAYGRSRQFPSLGVIGAHMVKSSLLCLAHGRLDLASRLSLTLPASGPDRRKAMLQHLALKAPVQPVPGSAGQGLGA